MKSKLFVGLLCLGLLLVTLAGCRAAEEPVVEPEEQATDRIINIGVLHGPTGMGIVQLMNDQNYNIEVVGSPDDLIGKIVTGAIDIAAVPSNLAAALYQRTERQIQLLAINTLGVIYILEDGENVTSIADLEGRTLYVSGKGTTPDFVIQYLLKEYGLEPGRDVIIDYFTQHADLAAIMVAGRHDLALLPQPFVTTVLMGNTNLRVALDLTEEWRNVLGTDLPMGVIIGQKEFILENEAALLTFLEKYEQSINFVNTNIPEAAALIAEHGILPNAQIAERAIPYSNIVFISATAGKPLLDDFYNVLYNFNPQFIGGEIPDDEFYFLR
ncbi:MAG TPA: ABC transporter substrate-binding protein [Candidatus Limnocylindrales bacterium]|nr:ABC transporter substrate-binding protein [Candidatus Limnocylindrales bacterium]